MQFFNDDTSSTIKLYEEEGDDAIIAKLKKITKNKEKGMLYEKETNISYIYNTRDAAEAEVTISNPQLITESSKVVKENPVWLVVGLHYLVNHKIIDKQYMREVLLDFMEKNNEYVENFLGSEDVVSALKRIRD